MRHSHGRRVQQADVRQPGRRCLEAGMGNHLRRQAVDPREQAQGHRHAAFAQRSG